MAKGQIIHHLTDKQLKDKKKKWQRNCMRSMELFSMLSLRDAFGFEGIDLMRFLEKLNEVIESFNEGRFTAKDILTVLDEETGIKFKDGIYSKGDEYMKDNLQSTTELVKAILEKFPATRDNDQLLYYRVCEALNEKSLTANFGYVILNRKDFMIPSIETVGRCRRKLQEKNPDLRASSKVQGFRDELQLEFREYAKG